MDIDTKDSLAFEFFNIILPATRVEDAMGNIKELVASGDIGTEVEDNILKTELYVANLAQRKIPLSTKILSQISKITYGKIYSWAGKLKVEARPAMEDMILKISSGWERSILDEELKLETLAFAYHCILKHKPFFDGNEKVARIFVNYLGLNTGPVFLV
jgi:fido (protein-threonine AMPylation protein)